MNYLTEHFSKPKTKRCCIEMLKGSSMHEIAKYKTKYVSHTVSTPDTSKNVRY